MTERQRREMGARAMRRRDQLGLTNEKIARTSGLSTKTVSRFMNGKHEPRGHTFELMAKTLKMPEQELRGTPPAPLGLAEPPVDDYREQLDRIEATLEALKNAVLELALGHTNQAARALRAQDAGTLPARSETPEHTAGQDARPADG